MFWVAALKKLNKSFPWQAPPSWLLKRTSENELEMARRKQGGCFQEPAGSCRAEKKNLLTRPCSCIMAGSWAIGEVVLPGAVTALTKTMTSHEHQELQGAQCMFTASWAWGLQRSLDTPPPLDNPGLTGELQDDEDTPPPLDDPQWQSVPCPPAVGPTWVISPRQHQHSCHGKQYAEIRRKCVILGSCCFELSHCSL